MIDVVAGDCSCGKAMDCSCTNNGDCCHISGANIHEQDNNGGNTVNDSGLCASARAGVIIGAVFGSVLGFTIFVVVSFLN